MFHLDRFEQHLELDCVSVYDMEHRSYLRDVH